MQDQLQEFLVEDAERDAESGAPSARSIRASPIVGECLRSEHPTLQGRVLVRWTVDAEGYTRWLPTLMNLPVRESDRVLVVQAANFDEPVVVGVIDGFAERPEPLRSERAGIELRRDECVRVHGTDGRELLEISEGDSGPVVRLARTDVELDLPGALRITADQIAMKARRGQVALEASDDVVVKGEVIHLN